MGANFYLVGAVFLTERNTLRTFKMISDYVEPTSFYIDVSSGSIPPFWPTFHNFSTSF